MKGFIPDPGGSGVIALLTAADAASSFAQRHLLGMRDAAVIEAADEALDLDDRPLDLDDWATDAWWLEQPAGGSS
ncbi:hypothetical protein [Arthrobacter sp. SLBN-53]|uniref:hypothetical protein n=1 Tax=Arthrobacter sp. SLBN-53 TaxID=2768412 RepID=UPI0011504F57|nr:hypothetical protein [Arthrobacter sp. SLBN-53]TQK29415.1 hypothetical protein FBY28_2418 [Arthrobacter sp. SLBN-53]